jgi:probable phosphoglycerate mutase
MYSSDLDRCVDTAEILNTNLQVPILYDPRLKERSFGSLEGKTWEEIDPSGELRESDRHQKYDYREHGGENAEGVKQRIFDSIRDIETKHPNDKILIVTSGGIIRLLHNILKGEVHAHIQNSSIHEFEFPDN